MTYQKMGVENDFIMVKTISFKSLKKKWNQFKTQVMSEYLIYHNNYDNQLNIVL
jgi:hypothetical protein